MRFVTIPLLFLTFMASPPARAQELTIGLAAPLSGDFRLLGQQWANGARAAAQGGTARLAEADSACTEEGGAAAARQLAAANASVVIGFLCTPAIEAAMPILKEAGIPVITPVRTNSLTDQKDRTGWPVFRLGPRADDESEAVAAILVPLWRREFFAIVDDGTIHGRELAETLRAEAELAKLEPVLVDTFRPQLDNQIGLVGRLRRAGATRVFVGGDRSDIAIMARDAEGLGYQVTFAGGEALRAEDGPVPLPAGVLMVGLPRWQDLATPEANAVLDEAGILPEGYVLPGFAAFQIAETASQEAAQAGLPVADALSRLSFGTGIGEIRFDEKGDLAGNLYRLFRYDGEQFVEAD
ncbi:branched-chain amino acid ABC transporter substrate-binding protein [Chelativorans sp. AA-79]|uniref:branched-chain amino acid ABC transporter substrate-binding protein n=1 Tax=Chelativorans sp. AA-79 TaxID=3028735 RepID=UPI0023F754D4|nr:branched-chain amino acid ABC transporter substrate-binding protein [Chelativorans sp. AA-79]WEX11889.1 branched-chain amino acid ABC transporter substrate-binding protein [Chelativorans sp. AA-79]